VARAAQVSKGAVSFALNGRPGVAETTRARILAAADDLGWTPNATARSLSTQRALAVGLVVAREPELLGADPFFPPFIAGIETVLHFPTRGRNLLRLQGDLLGAYALGIRSLFIAHWFDNAFAGAALEDGTKGEFINAMNRLETGHYFRVGKCPLPGQGEHAIVAPPAILKIVVTYFPGVTPLLKAPVPTYPKALSCNARGLTTLGEYLVRQMMAKHMMIEADHLSERARDRVLSIAAAHHYPLISSHTGTGGTWTPTELRRLYALGGLAATQLAAPLCLGIDLRSEEQRHRREPKPRERHDHRG